MSNTDQFQRLRDEDGYIPGVDSSVEGVDRTSVTIPGSDRAVESTITPERAQELARLVHDLGREAVDLANSQ